MTTTLIDGHIEINLFGGPSLRRKMSEIPLRLFFAGKKYSLTGLDREHNQAFYKPQAKRFSIRKFIVKKHKEEPCRTK